MATKPVSQLQVKKPHALLFDLISTVAKSSFVDKVLLPYISNNIKIFLEENWESQTVQNDINDLRVQSKEDTDAPKIPDKSDDRAQMIDAVAAYVRHCSNLHQEGKTAGGNAMTILQYHMWFDGFKRERLETPVYSDVAMQLQKWRVDKGIKLYVISNGWAQAIKRFLDKTNRGNMNQLIEGHFDTSLGQLDDPATYRKVLDQIKEPAESVLFLTKSADEGRAAMQAGMNSILVLTHRRNIDKLDEESKKMPRVRSFNDLDFVE